MGDLCCYENKEKKSITLERVETDCSNLCKLNWSTNFLGLYVFFFNIYKIINFIKTFF